MSNYYKTGLEYYKSNNFNKAIESYKKGAELNNYQCIEELSKHYLEYKDEQHVPYTIICVENTQNINLMLILGDYFAVKKDFINSEKYYLMVYEKGDLSGLTRICELLNFINHRDINIINKYRDIIISHKQNINSEAFVFLAELYKDIEDVNEMIKLYKYAIDKNDANAMHYLGQFYGINTSEGLELLHTATEHKCLDAAQNLACHFFLNKKYNLAKTYYTKLFKIWNNGSYINNTPIRYIKTSNKFFNNITEVSEYDLGIQSLSFIHYGFLCHKDNNIIQAVKYYNLYIDYITQEYSYDSVIEDIKEMYKVHKFPRENGIYDILKLINKNTENKDTCSHDHKKLRKN